MRTLIISDLHLSKKFEPARLTFLEKLCSNTDRVIINGDFWDLHSNTFAEFLASPWQQLFPLLKSKHTIYIEGNHDHARDTGKEIASFVEAHLSEFIFKSGKYTLHVEHGHRKLHKKSETSPWVIKGFRTLKYNTWFRDPLEKYLISNNNDTLHRWHMSKHEDTLRELAQNLPDNHILVTGHTHLPAFDPARHYINTGYINHGIAYSLRVENGTLTYTHEQYAPEQVLISQETA